MKIFKLFFVSYILLVFFTLFSMDIHANPQIQALIDLMEVL